MLSGLWLQSDCTDNLTDRRIAWSLVLSPHAPSVYGAAIDLHDAGRSTLSILSGEFDATALTVHIVESSSIDVAAPTVEWRGAVRDGALLVLRRVGDDSERLTMHLEARNPALHHSGAWTGAAAPHADLAPFGLPTNPAFWSLSILPSVRLVFGAGFFDDAGDVPGRPMLRFTLKGVVDANGVVRFRKVYEPLVTDAPIVEYEARLLVSDGGAECRIEGTWKNGDAHGDLCVFLEGANSTPHMALCTVCGSLLPPGCPRFASVEPAFEFVACLHCRPLSAVAAETFEGHAIKPMLTVQSPPLPVVQCAAELVHAALTTHADRVLFRWLRSKTLTYGETGALVARVSALLFDRDRAALENVLRKRPVCLVIANSSVMGNIVLLAATLAGYTVAHASESLPGTTLQQLRALLSPSLVIRAATAAADIGDSLVFEEDPQCTSGSSQSINRLLQFGQRVALSDIVPDRAAADSTAFILFTSGSTGLPKAARFSETLALPAALESSVFPCVRLDFAPFDPSHVLSLLGTLAVGGTRALGTLDDAEWARPTLLGAPPSVWAAFARRIDVDAQALVRAGLPAAGARKQAANAVRASLGSRLVVATSGGAALAAGVADALRDLRINVVELYATRETGGIARDGVVYPGVLVKLLPLGDVSPSSLIADDIGQIAVHSPRLISGYVGASESSAAAFQEIDGKTFYLTGDIGRFVVDGGGVRRLRVTGRLSECSKRTDGTWASPPAATEAVLEQCAGVKRACVLVTKSGVGAVICGSVDAKEAFVRCRAAGIATQDVPACFLAVADELPVTPNGKLDRAAIRRAHEAALESCARVTSASCAEAVSESLCQQIRSAVHLADDVPLAASATLYDIGGDSIAAVRLAKLTKLSVAQLLSLTLGEIDLLVSKQVSLGGVASATEDAIRRDAQLPLSVRELVQRAKPFDGSKAMCVLVTGANGFCARGIIAELTVRGIAFVPLVRRAASGGALLGDVRLPNLGLSDEQLADLTATVTDVIHCAAVVDHLRPYAALREANVVGTLHVLEFAATCGARVHFLSSIAALPAGDALDSEQALSISVEQLLQKNGYGASKAVAELLVVAAGRAGLPVVVHRPGTVSASLDGSLVPASDAGIALVRACATLRARPARAALLLCWTPIDAVAHAVVGALLEPRQAAAQVFNLVAGAAPSVDAVLAAAERASGAAPWRRLGAQQFEAELQLLDDAHESAALKAMPIRWHESNASANAAAAVECRAVERLLGSDWRTRFAVDQAALDNLCTKTLFK